MTGLALPDVLLLLILVGSGPLAVILHRRLSVRASEPGAEGGR